jgi:transcriptional regulator with XRE-family HTH domain
LTEVSFGEWLKRQRNGRGLTQEQLAHQIGCAAITVRKIEAEERRPSVQIIERLAEIFNIPPNEQKRFLRYARGELKYAMQDSIEETPWHATVSTRTNLPAGVTALIGRESELVEIRAYLMRAEVRLVTLIGPPGIGKTRLGIRFPIFLMAFSLWRWRLSMTHP